ncbi:MAG TPA: hypothetical protein VFE84_01390 [Patescibacteria group bacterium]|nr:hypothetical protein [Patescibacteria group bacterium]
MNDRRTKKPRSSAGLSTVVAFAFIFLPLAAAADDSLKLPKPTADDRDEYIRRSRVWEPTDVASKDLYNGPVGKLKFAVDQEITCDFVPRPLGGFTAKFLCRLEDGSIAKVKYEQGSRYKEVYGEVLGTRLFWALGFPADKMLPVRVTCRGCPRYPWKYIKARKNKHGLDEKGLIRSFPPEAEIGTYTFDPAAMEEKFDAELIEVHKDQGWSWSALKKVDDRLGGATRAEIDALRLLNAFVQNADNKYKQNQLVCPRKELVKSDDGKVTCGHPVMYVDDLGAVFGKGGLTTGYSGRVDLDAWRKRHVWRRSRSCKARLASIGWILRKSTLRDPVISEEGRALLARQLEQLSDKQIADLFRAARIDRLHQMTTDGHSPPREVTVQDWVDLFKKKRSEITQHPACPRRHGSAASDAVP